MTFDVFAFLFICISYSYLMRDVREEMGLPDLVKGGKKKQKIENLQIKTIMGIAVRDNE